MIPTSTVLATGPALKRKRNVVVLHLPRSMSALFSRSTKHTLRKVNMTCVTCSQGHSLHCAVDDDINAFPGGMFASRMFSECFASRKKVSVEIRGTYWSCSWMALKLDLPLSVALKAKRSLTSLRRKPESLLNDLQHRLFP